MKRLRSGRQYDFDREAEALEYVRNDNNPHLIKLLATYYDESFYNLIFPWAAGNLQDYWQWHSKAQRPTILWVITQCLGIAKALQRIHHYSFPGEGGQAKMGRHGDIKPENILWFPSETTSGTNDQGVLVLSDFGLTRFHHTDSVHRTYRTLAASPTYRAPDFDLKERISPFWDIWSLGCVYLEFLTWYLQGYKAVERFSEQRANQDFAPYVREDKFFVLEEGAELRAYVKSSVTKVRCTFCSAEMKIHQALMVGIANRGAPRPPRVHSPDS